MVIHRNIDESRKRVGQNYWDRVAGSCWVRGEVWFWEGHKDRISESELLATFVAETTRGGVTVTDRTTVDYCLVVKLVLVVFFCNCALLLLIVQASNMNTKTKF
jgi:hypothetical protein